MSSFIYQKRAQEVLRSLNSEGWVIITETDNKIQSIYRAVLRHRKNGSSMRIQVTNTYLCLSRNGKIIKKESL